jgi:MFS family permease
MANTVPQLVLARVLQGIGGSIMTPVGRIIMVASVPREDLVRGMAWYTLPAILAPLVGPPIAGFLIECADWRWIFFINVPVGLLGIAAVLRYVPVLPPTRRQRFDLSGFLLAGVSILAIMALVETNAGAGNPLPLRLLAVAAAAMVSALYVRQALRTEDPIADFHVLRHASLRWSLLATWMHRIALGGIMLLLPLQMQIGLGYSPLVSSQVMICSAIGSVLSRFITPAAIRTFGFRRLMLTFGAITTVMSLIPATFGPATPILAMGAVMLVHSSIRASFFMAGNTLSYCDVHGEEVGHASVLFAMSQQLSLGFGFSLATTVLDWAGGPHDPAAFVTSYGAMVLLQAVGTAAILPLAARAGASMQQRASA